MIGSRVRSGGTGREGGKWEAVAAIAAAVAALAAVVGLVLGNVGGGDDDDGDGSTTTTDAVGGTTGSTTGGTTGSTGTTEGPDATTTTVDRFGPDLALFLEPGCEIVGGGGLSGADVMTFFFRARSVGEESYGGSIRTTARSDSGLEGSSTGGVSDGPASSFVQVEVAPQDYGRTHAFSITIEATERLDETDLANNTDEVTVPLPPSPPNSGQVIDPCS